MLDLSGRHVVGRRLSFLHELWSWDVISGRLHGLHGLHGLRRGYGHARRHRLCRVRRG